MGIVFPPTIYATISPTDRIFAIPFVKLALLPLDPTRYFKLRQATTGGESIYHIMAPSISRQGIGMVKMPVVNFCLSFIAF